MVTKKQIILGIAVVSGASAIAFFVFKAVKISKELNNDIIYGDVLEEDLFRNKVRKEVAEYKNKIDLPLEKDEDEHPEVILYSDEEYIVEEPEESYDEEGDVDVLKYDKNSPQALEQYKNMMLAEFDRMGDSRKVMMRLFDHPFSPTNELDERIIDHIYEDRENFFGENSIFNDDSTIAELLLYFATLADFDIDGGIEYWVNQFIAQLGIWSGMGENMLEMIIEDLVNHKFINQDTHGMFGLESYEYNELYKDDRSPFVTFLMQYHVILSKSDPSDYDYMGDYLDEDC